jgi:hypothetical protein
VSATTAATEKAACPVCSEPTRVTTQGTLYKHGTPVPCTGTGQAVGTARIPRRAQGFYRDPATGERLRSVTTILGQGSPKEALVHWAGRLVAETAMDNLPRLVRASRRPEDRREVTDWLKRAHTRKKDERAGLGSAVHELIEAHILGTPVPSGIASDPEMRPYVRHFQAFVDEWEITFTASEMVVAHYDERYAGTLDYRLRSPLLAAALQAPSPDLEILGDTKTGGELDKTTYDGHVHGVYPEAGIQMAAYREAPYGWLRDGTRIPMPPAHDIGVVLHLRPEGYRLYPVRCGAAEFEVFRTIRQVAEFQTGPAKSVVGTALTPPKTPARKVA